MKKNVLCLGSRPKIKKFCVLFFPLFEKNCLLRTQKREKFVCETRSLIQKKSTHFLNMERKNDINDVVAAPPPRQTPLGVVSRYASLFIFYIFFFYINACE